MHSHLGTRHAGWAARATQTWQTCATPATNDALRTWFAWCPLFRKIFCQYWGSSTWNRWLLILDKDNLCDYYNGPWLDVYLLFLLVGLVILFRLVSQAHLFVQKVPYCQENRHYQGVREAHPCLQALRYQGDRGYPKGILKRRVWAALSETVARTYWCWSFLRKACQTWFIAWRWI